MTKKEFDELEQKTAGIQGCVSRAEMRLLYDLAKNCTGAGIIVEIGSWKGKSTIALGLGSLHGNGAKVYAIDPHTGSPDQRRDENELWSLDEFKKNIANAGLSSIVEPLVTTSEKAAIGWDKPIELIFIDANYHDESLTRRDFLTWTPHLVNGGIYALHNTIPSVAGILEGIPLHGCEAPRIVLNDTILKSKIFKYKKAAGTITAMEKCVKNTRQDWLLNHLIQQKSSALYALHSMYLTLTALPPPIKKILKQLLLLRTNRQ